MASSSYDHLPSVRHSAVRSIAEVFRFLAAAVAVLSVFGIVTLYGNLDPRDAIGLIIFYATGAAVTVAGLAAVGYVLPLLLDMADDLCLLVDAADDEDDDEDDDEAP